MDSYHLKIFCAVLILQGIGANILPCYSGDNNNATLDNTIHLSDVVLVGRIVSLEEGEFGTHSAVISYYNTYKSDGLLLRVVLWRTKVTNFVPAPSLGQLGTFFLTREPNMQLALFCMTSIPMLMEYNPKVSYKATIEHIKEVGTNDTMRNAGFAVPYPDPCDNNACGGGAYCNLKNILPPATTRCSCSTGFFRNHSTGLCQSRTVGAAISHCPQCSHGARCLLSQTNVTAISCSCAHFQCAGLPERPRCGSNGREYAGLCQMKLEACEQQRSIHLLYSGNCRSLVPQPCMGLGEPLATSSGLVQCSNYNYSCPTQHFCHSTSSYSVCCPVGVMHPSSTPSFVPTPTVPTPSTTPTHTGTADCISGSGSGSRDDGSGSGRVSDLESSGDSDTEHDNC